MKWYVEFTEEFEAEFDRFPLAVQDELLAQAMVIAHFGPAARRPRVDTLKGSRHSNMKELRFSIAGGVWRIAFAFDRRRRAILLVGGDKSGLGQRLFYRRLIAVADRRLDQHLRRLSRSPSQH